MENKEIDVREDCDMIDEHHEDDGEWVTKD